MTKNKQKQLTDSEYVDWAKKDWAKTDWSFLQMIYFLHGRVPPESEEVTKDQLIEYFPHSKKMIDSIPEKKLTEYSKSIEDWALYASSDNGFALDPFDEKIANPTDEQRDINDCWKLIYPYRFPDRYHYLPGVKLDYRSFIKALGADIPIALGELVKFALNLFDERMAGPPFAINFRDAKMSNPPEARDRLLDVMNKWLDLKAEHPDELFEWKVRPMRFMERCSEDEFAYDSECLRWYSLLLKHPKIAKFLNPPIQTNEVAVTQVPKSKNTKVNTRIQKGDNSLSKKGGAARAALYAPLIQEAIKLYNEGQFKSKRQASKELYQPIKILTYNKKINISAPRPSTIESWLPKIN